MTGLSPLVTYVPATLSHTFTVLPMYLDTLSTEIYVWADIKKGSKVKIIILEYFSILNIYKVKTTLDFMQIEFMTNKYTLAFMIH